MNKNIVFFVGCNVFSGNLTKIFNQKIEYPIFYGTCQLHNIRIHIENILKIACIIPEKLWENFYNRTHCFWNTFGFILSVEVLSQRHSRIK